MPLFKPKSKDGFNPSPNRDERTEANIPLQHGLGVGGRDTRPILRLCADRIDARCAGSDHTIGIG